jgi:hypothetical protein
MRALGWNAGFRDTMVSTARLWEIVEDRDVLSALRAGAAVALRASLDRSGRERLLAVAQACEASPLGAVLEAASVARDSYDDETIQVLLAAFS